MPAIEHKNLNELALKVKVEVDQITKRFKIDSESDELKYEVQTQALIRFLVAVAHTKISG